MMKLSFSRNGSVADVHEDWSSKGWQNFLELDVRRPGDCAVSQPRGRSELCGKTFIKQQYISNLNFPECLSGVRRQHKTLHSLRIFSTLDIVTLKLFIRHTSPRSSSNVENSSGEMIYVFWRLRWYTWRPHWPSNQRIRVFRVFSWQSWETLRHVFRHVTRGRV